MMSETVKKFNIKEFKKKNLHIKLIQVLTNITLDLIFKQNT